MQSSPVLRAVAGALFALALVAPGTAFAITAQGQQMMRTWAQSDRCVAAATKQFPDYTAESLAKRDQSVQQCLSNSLLPPRAPVTPQPPKP
jgi:hypothetical protein